MKVSTRWTTKTSNEQLMVASLVVPADTLGSLEQTARSHLVHHDLHFCPNQSVIRK
ncbi:hypothetical protein RvY_05684 [Ramazzottius varieornatus]|uniref:Uncharacterized protein n=1 Tax=Ramazzottius varieornatus TaxID=947166 RepID=A0A1D1UYW5_RAMVA|nr:hypothetical protein RvY_05684 [Ramazzottius varieornatus]